MLAMRYHGTKYHYPGRQNSTCYRYGEDRAPENGSAFRMQMYLSFGQIIKSLLNSQMIAQLVKWLYLKFKYEGDAEREIYVLMPSNGI